MGKIEGLFDILSLMRVNQYVKNMLIFAPSFFAAEMFNKDIFLQLAICFIGFSLITSFVYIINDIKDIELDRKHPLKRLRPIASGNISIKKAVIIAILSIVLGFIILPKSLSVIALGYIVLNILYTYKIKEYAIIDVVTIALMYLVRLIIGSIATCINLSHWIIILTFLLALFLAFSKRYDDLKYDKKQKVRKNIDAYSVSFIENTMAILASIIVVSYILYTISPEVIENFNCEYVYLTSIFVLVGILRYLQLTFVYKISSSPTKILYKDFFLKSVIILWIASYICIIYL